MTKMRDESEIRGGLIKLLRIQPEDKISAIRVQMSAQLGTTFKKGATRKFDVRVALNAEDLMKSMEEIIRATEICTLKWVLNQGGGLNTKPWGYKVKRMK